MCCYIKYLPVLISGKDSTFIEKYPMQISWFFIIIFLRLYVPEKVQ